MNYTWPPLPEYDPHPDLWPRVESDLMTDETLSRVICALTDYEPKADLWNAIEHELQASEKTKLRPLWPQLVAHSRWVGLAVAAVVALVGTWLFLRPEIAEEVRMEYAIEQTDILPQGNQCLSDKRAEEFIARQCAEQHVVCQRPEVHELRNQLVELAAEQQRIEHERQIFGDEPTLVRAHVRIENQRAEVTKELITILRS